MFSLYGVDQRLIVDVLDRERVYLGRGIHFLQGRHRRDSRCQFDRQRITITRASVLDGSFNAFDQVVYLKWLSEQAGRAGGRGLGLKLRV